MRILEKHIIKKILIIFIATILVFSFLYILIDITSTLDEIIDRKIPLDILFKYYITYIPIILTQTSSIACLIATLFTFSSLNNNNEIIAMRASGLTFWQITKPALFFGVIVSVFVFYLNERYVPQANARMQEIRNENMILLSDRLIKQKEKIKNLTFYGLKNRLFFIDSFDPRTYDIEGITIIEHDENQNMLQKTIAFEGKWTGIAWKFYKCQITNYDSHQINAPIKIKVYEEKLMDIKETPNDFLKQKISVSSMNLKQLSEYYNKFKNSGAKKALNNVKVDMHQKAAYPFGNFVIILTGLPFALLIKGRKRSTFAALGLAIIIGFLFYVANAVALAFGKADFFPPAISAWITPFLFCSIAIAVIENNF